MIRRRKNDEENTVPSRQTRRRGCKAIRYADSNDSNVDCVHESEKSEENTMNNDIYKEINIAGFKIKESMSVTEESQSSLKNTGKEVVTVNSKRKMEKDAELLISEDESPPAKKHVTKIKSYARKSGKTNVSPVKRLTYITRSKSNQIATLIREYETDEEVFDHIKNGNSISSGASIISEDNSFVANYFDSTKNSITSKTRSPVDVKKKSFSQKSSKHNAKSSIDVVTPESSPVIVNLTPHRSTKTPIKSPINLGSPKTHSETLRLFQTPKKLSIIVDSYTSDTSSVSSNQSTPEKQANTIDVLTDVDEVVTKSSPISEKPRTSKMKLLSSKLSKSRTVQKSKSPRKYARSLTSKVNKSSTEDNFIKTPNETSTNLVKSPSIETSKTVLKLAEINLSALKTPVQTRARKNSSSISKTREFPVKLSSANNKLSSPKLISLTEYPKVVLKKMLSPKLIPKSKTRNSLTKASSFSIKSPTGTSVKTLPIIKISVHDGESPRRSKSMSKSHSPMTNCGISLRSIPTPKSSTLERPTSKMLDFITNVSSETTNENFDISKVLILSTSRGTIRQPSNISPDFKTVSPEATSSPLDTLRISPKSLWSSEVDVNKFTARSNNNKFGRSINDTELLNTSNVFVTDDLDKNNTYDIEKQIIITGEKEQKNEKDVTYELLEPKTPNLQKKSRKRSLSDSALDRNDREKKRCRVRFASPVLDDTNKKLITSEHSKVHSSNPVLYTERKETCNLVNTLSEVRAENADTNSFETKVIESFRRRRHSVTNVDAKMKITKLKTRRSNSVSNANTGTPRGSQKIQNISTNRLSQPRLSIHSDKKPEIKMPAAKKAPNFSQMHERKFARMESLVDAKKRVEERHNTLSKAVKLNTSKLPTRIPSLIAPAPLKFSTSINTVNIFNKQDTRLRKNEARDIIAKKQLTITREKRQQESRMILKGVCTNRRFELQMKLRNRNL